MIHLKINDGWICVHQTLAFISRGFDQWILEVPDKSNTRVVLDFGQGDTRWNALEILARELRALPNASFVSIENGEIKQLPIPQKEACA